MKTCKEWVNYFDEKYGRQQFNVACGLEQAYKHSLKEKYCAECGSMENLIKQSASAWINLEYYLCADCDNYYKNK